MSLGPNATSWEAAESLLGMTPLRDRDEALSLLVSAIEYVTADPELLHGLLQAMASGGFDAALVRPPGGRGSLGVAFLLSAAESARQAREVEDLQEQLADALARLGEVEL